MLAQAGLRRSYALLSGRCTLSMPRVQHYGVNTSAPRNVAPLHAPSMLCSVRANPSLAVTQPRHLPLLQPYLQPHHPLHHRELSGVRFFSSSSAADSKAESGKGDEETAKKASESEKTDKEETADQKENEKGDEKKEEEKAEEEKTEEEKAEEEKKKAEQDEEEKAKQRMAAEEAYEDPQTTREILADTLYRVFLPVWRAFRFVVRGKEMNTPREFWEARKKILDERFKVTDRLDELEKIRSSELRLVGIYNKLEPFLGRLGRRARRFLLFLLICVPLVAGALLYSLINTVKANVEADEDNPSPAMEEAAEFFKSLDVPNENDDDMLWRVLHMSRPLAGSWIDILDTMLQPNVEDLSGMDQLFHGVTPLALGYLLKFIETNPGYLTDYIELPEELDMTYFKHLDAMAHEIQMNYYDHGDVKQLDYENLVHGDQGATALEPYKIKWKKFLDDPHNAAIIPSTAGLGPVPVLKQFKDQLLKYERMGYNRVEEEAAKELWRIKVRRRRLLGKKASKTPLRVTKDDVRVYLLEKTLEKHGLGELSPSDKLAQNLYGNVAALPEESVEFAKQEFERETAKFIEIAQPELDKLAKEAKKDMPEQTEEYHREMLEKTMLEHLDLNKDGSLGPSFDMKMVTGLVLDQLVQRTYYLTAMREDLLELTMKNPPEVPFDDEPFAGRPRMLRDLYTEEEWKKLPEEVQNTTFNPTNEVQTYERSTQPLVAHFDHLEAELKRDTTFPEDWDGISLAEFYSELHDEPIIYYTKDGTRRFWHRKGAAMRVALLNELANFLKGPPETMNFDQVIKDARRNGSITSDAHEAEVRERLQSWQEGRHKVKQIFENLRTPEGKTMTEAMLSVVNSKWATYTENYSPVEDNNARAAAIHCLQKILLQPDLKHTLPDPTAITDRLEKLRDSMHAQYFYDPMAAVHESVQLPTMSGILMNTASQIDVVALNQILNTLDKENHPPSSMPRMMPEPNELTDRTPTATELLTKAAIGAITGVSIAAHEEARGLERQLDVARRENDWEEISGIYDAMAKLVELSPDITGLLGDPLERTAEHLVALYEAGRDDDYCRLFEKVYDEDCSAFTHLHRFYYGMALAAPHHATDTRLKGLDIMIEAATVPQIQTLPLYEARRKIPYFQSIANLYMEFGDFPKALAAADSFRDVCPKCYSANFYFGKLLLQSRQFNKAVGPLHYAADLQPQRPEWQLYSAAAFAKTKHADLAVEKLEKAAEQEMKPTTARRVHKLKAKLHLSNGQWDEAKRSLEIAEKIVPYDTWVTFKLGLTNEALGDTEAAKRYFGNTLDTWKSLCVSGDRVGTKCGLYVSEPQRSTAFASIGRRCTQDTYAKSSMCETYHELNQAALDAHMSRRHGPSYDALSAALKGDAGGKPAYM